MTDRKDKIKRLALFAAVVLFFASISASLCMVFGRNAAETVRQEQAEREQDEISVGNNGEGSVFDVGVVREEGIGLAFASATVRTKVLLAGDTTECVSRTVTATITPSTVVDKYVTWSVAWDGSAPLKDRDINEYLTVTQETEGDLTASVNCYKAFKGSKAILTCTTRQGNKRATAEVRFLGAPSGMEINSPSGADKTDIGAMNVDMLYVGNSYSLDLSLDNIFHDVGAEFSDFTVTVSGVGTVTCGTYSRSPRGAGWGSHSNVVEFGSIANEFISGSVTDYTLTLSVTKSFYDYYESMNSHMVEGNGETFVYTNKLYSLNIDADGNCPYFVITVRHNTLGFSAQYKCFIGETVNSVAMDKSAVVF